MDQNDLKAAFQQLDHLSQEEYHKPLSDVASVTKGDEQTCLLQIGRLIGVTMKQPLAKPRNLDAPSPTSGAYRAWDLKSQRSLQNKSVRASWQYQTLEALRQDQDVIDSLGRQPKDVFELAKLAHHERGFFGYLVVSCRKYLCRDSKLRKEVETQVKAAQKAGLDVKQVSPELIVGSGGLALGAALIQQIPILGYFGAPVIAGLVLLIYSIGLDAFCGWAKDRYLVTADKEQ